MVAKESITYYCILLANAQAISRHANPCCIVVPAITERYIDYIKAFVPPLLGHLVGEVLRLCR